MKRISDIFPEQENVPLEQLPVTTLPQVLATGKGFNAYDTDRELFNEACRATRKKAETGMVWRRYSAHPMEGGIFIRIK